MANDQQSSEYAVEPPIAPVEAYPPPVWTRTDLSDQDVLCVGCGYNLRGAKAEGHCPECGTAIGRSIQGNRLVFSSADYLAGLQRGLTVALLATIVSIGLGLAIMVTVFVLTFSGAGVVPRDAQFWTSIVGVPLGIAQLWGWWLFTAPDPAVQYGDKGDRPRQVLRVSLIVMLLTNLVSASLGMGMSATVTAQALATATMIVGAAAWLAKFFASLLYVRWLARRMPDSSIDGRARVYLWVLPLVHILGVCLLALGPIVAAVLYLLLLNDVRLRLRDIRERQPMELARLGIAQ